MSRARNDTPSHSYRVSLAIWDHTALPATRHKWTHPALTPARQAGTRFTYTPERWKAKLIYATGYIPRKFIQSSFNFHTEFVRINYSRWHSNENFRILSQNFSICSYTQLKNGDQTPPCYAFQSQCTCTIFLCIHLYGPIMYKTLKRQILGRIRVA